MKCISDDVTMTFSNADYTVDLKVGQKLWFLVKNPEYMPRQGTLQLFNASTDLCDDGDIRAIFHCEFKELPGKPIPIEHIRRTYEEVEKIATDFFEANKKDLTVE